MPIREENRKRYPSDWKAISRRIRDRDGNRCKWCGVPNGALVTRDDTGKWYALSPSEAEVASLIDGDVVTMIVLTVAHLDRTPEHCDDDNLVALCQKCHLNYDLRIHVSNAAKTRRLRKEERGQIALGIE